MSLVELYAITVYHNDITHSVVFFICKLMYNLKIFLHLTLISPLIAEGNSEQAPSQEL